MGTQQSAGPGAGGGMGLRKHARNDSKQSCSCTAVLELASLNEFLCIYVVRSGDCQVEPIEHHCRFPGVHKRDVNGEIPLTIFAVRDARHERTPPWRDTAV